MLRASEKDLPVQMGLKIAPIVPMATEVLMATKVPMATMFQW